MRFSQALSAPAPPQSAQKALKIARAKKKHLIFAPSLGKIIWLMCSGGKQAAQMGRKSGLAPPHIRSGIEVVITALTRNQVYRQRYRGFESHPLRQISCLICLPDKSGNFLAFRAKIAQNTVKSTKTGSVVVDLTAAEPVFLIFRAKIPRTFWGKCTKQSSRKKAAVGGFEPQD